MNHIQDDRASMVDVSDKPVTARLAVARGVVHMRAETLERIRARDLVKGEVLQVARLAGILAAKRTDELIPLCHGLGLDAVDVRFVLDDDASCVHIEATSRCQGRTGVEMEAMVAASIAAMTLYDMCKGIDREMVVGSIHLARKEGGKSGLFVHPDPPAPLLPDDPRWE